jgi:hypothetical protein
MNFFENIKFYHIEDFNLLNFQINNLLLSNDLNLNKENLFEIIDFTKNNFIPYKLFYQKNKENIYEYPEKTFILYLSNNAPITAIFDLNIDNYKYKNFKYENNCIFINPEEGKLILIDPTKICVFLENNDCENVKIINIWKSNLVNKNLSKLNFEYSNNNLKLNCIKINQEILNIENTIFNENFYENFFYKKQYSFLNDLYLQINDNLDNKKIKNNIFIKSSKYPFQNNIFFKKLINKYGEFINDLYELEINNNFTIKLNNNLCNTHFFSTTICNWIVEELKMNNKLWEKVENNFYFLPSLSVNYLNTFLFNYQQVITTIIKEKYNNTLNLNITNLFFEKNKDEKYFNLKNNEYFIFFKILLSGAVKIIFNNEKNLNYILNPGDLIISFQKEFTITPINSNNEENIFITGFFNYIL